MVEWRQKFCVGWIFVVGEKDVSALVRSIQHAFSSLSYTEEVLTFEGAK